MTRTAKTARPRTDARRALPAIEPLVAALAARPEAAGVPRTALVLAARAVLAEARAAKTAPRDDDAWPRLVLERARDWLGDGAPRVLNATGVPLHTNLGRAPLPAAAVEALTRAASHYGALEYDLPKGRRSQRGAAAEARLCALTGAEAALVVNNNAASVLLLLSALATDRGVIVSRGELIEIGGSYRLPDVMEKSGARLVEVGTTNRTHLRDYERALDRHGVAGARGVAPTGRTAPPPIALVLRVHPSNYRQIGFTARPALAELAELCHRRRVPLAEDLGSGALVDYARFGLPGEPTVPALLRGGADLVCFSGDKLLGGPQAGILVGRRRWIEACHRDPLARALRVDKLTLAALEATLALYFDVERAVRDIPALRMLSAPPEELRARAERLAAALGTLPGVKVSVRAASGEAGGGTLPGVEMPSFVVVLAPGRDASVHLEAALRAGAPPLIARLQSGQVWLDARTLLGEDDLEVARVVRSAVEAAQRGGTEPGGTRERRAR
jgi:L-seryl-tRNA(Ser) seleniumtransferase